jgi:hypothetical protein
MPAAGGRSLGGSLSRTAPVLAVLVALAVPGCAGPAEPGTAPSSASSQRPAGTIPPAPARTGPATSAPTTGTTSITSPAQGSTVAGPQVAVTGAGTAVEGTLSWRIAAAGSTAVVLEGFTTAGANGVVGPFSFTVDLQAGRYTLQVWEPGLADGATADAGAGRRGLVTATFTVT